MLWSEVVVRTGEVQVVDLTGEVRRFVAGQGDGLCSLLAPHATCGLALMEVGSGSEADLEGALERVLPRDDRYRHSHGSAGHGADHLLPVFVSPSLVLPVHRGSPVLGTWQSVVLVDTNRDNPERRVLLSFLASGPDPGPGSGTESGRGPRRD